MRALLVLFILAFAGCMGEPDMTIEYGLSEPYDISSSVIDMKIDADTVVWIDNSGGSEIRFSVDEAKLTAFYENGEAKTIEGGGQKGTINKDENYPMRLSFKAIPIQFQMMDDPPRMHSTITHYDINVTFTGQKKILFFWSPEYTKAKSIRIPMKDTNLKDMMSNLKENFKVQKGT